MICNAAPPVTSVSCPTGTGWSSDSSKCYFVSTTTANQADARSACRAMNVPDTLSSDLVSISDAAENTYVSGKA